MIQFVTLTPHTSFQQVCSTLTSVVAFTRKGPAGRPDVLTLKKREAGCRLSKGTGASDFHSQCRMNGASYWLAFHCSWSSTIFSRCCCQRQLVPRVRNSDYSHGSTEKARVLERGKRLERMEPLVRLMTSALLITWPSRVLRIPVHVNFWIFLNCFIVDVGITLVYKLKIQYTNLNFLKSIAIIITSF